jgi:hypothetical protein
MNDVNLKQTRLVLKRIPDFGNQLIPQMKCEGSQKGKMKKLNVLKFGQNKEFFDSFSKVNKHLKNQCVLIPCCIYPASNEF